MVMRSQSTWKKIITMKCTEDKSKEPEKKFVVVIFPRLLSPFIT